MGAMCHLLNLSSARRDRGANPFRCGGLAALSYL
jgi:hypothetical protein